MISIFDAAVGLYMKPVTITTSAGYVKADGTIDTEATTYKHTQHISCSEIIEFGYTGYRIGTDMYIAVFFDSSDNVIWKYGKGTSTGKQFTDQKVPIPEGASYVIFSSQGDNTFQIKKRIQDTIDNYTGNGDVILTPTKCSHKQEAAGKYDLQLEHPIDKEGKWMHIVPEAIIRAPVPKETIENAFSGLDVDVYKTTESAALRSGPSEPTTITYSAWASGTSYAVGSKVTSNGQNYQLNQELTGNEIYQNPGSSGKWAKIANKTAGSPVIVNLKSGAQLYYVSGPESGWYKMSTTYGLEGYIKSSQVTYYRHLTPSEMQPRVITEQLFRIVNVTVDTKNNKITATAEHVSYDLSGVMIEDADIHQKNPAQAMAWIESAFMMGYQGTLATNMTDDSDGMYTGEFKGKNATYALLDPDKGLVGSFGAMYRRDNWDVFMLRKNSVNRGFQLRYGKNMLGVNWKIQRPTVTRVVPVAKAEDGSDLYLNPTKWVDSEHINEYPVIRMERLKVEGQVGKDDGTETDTVWTEETLRAKMEEKALERFRVDKADLLVHDITIDFEMLGDTEEYKSLKSLEEVLMYDTVIAINEHIKMSVTVQVSEIEYDCIRKKVTALKLTNVNAYNGRNVSGFNVFNNSITPEKLTDDVTGGIAAAAIGESNDYTDGKVSGLNYSLRAWASSTFAPISSGE